jgi:hypothetical protein
MLRFAGGRTGWTASWPGRTGDGSTDSPGRASSGDVVGSGWSDGSAEGSADEAGGDSSACGGVSPPRAGEVTIAGFDAFDAAASATIRTWAPAGSAASRRVRSSPAGRSPSSHAIVVRSLFARHPRAGAAHFAGPRVASTSLASHAVPPSGRTVTAYRTRPSSGASERIEATSRTGAEADAGAASRAMAMPATADSVLRATLVPHASAGLRGGSGGGPQGDRYGL